MLLLLESKATSSTPPAGPPVVVTTHPQLRWLGAGMGMFVMAVLRGIFGY